MGRISKFKYMRSSCHRIAGRADLQLYWFDKISIGTHVELTEDRKTILLKTWIYDGVIRANDILYITELSRLGDTYFEMENILRELHNKNIKLIPIRHSLSAKMVNTDFFELEPAEQQILLSEAKEVYKKELSTMTYTCGNLILLDSPEEESLLLAVLQGKIRRYIALPCLGVCEHTLRREIYRKKADLLERQESIPEFSEEILQLVMEQRKIRNIKKTKKYFNTSNPIKVVESAEETE